MGDEVSRQIITWLLFALWGLSLLLVNALRLRMSKYETTMDDHMKAINANTGRINDVRLETSQNYVTKIDLSDLKKRMDEMASDIKAILRETRK